LQKAWSEKISAGFCSIDAATARSRPSVASSWNFARLWNGSPVLRGVDVPSGPMSVMPSFRSSPLASMKACFSSSQMSRSSSPSSSASSAAKTLGTTVQPFSQYSCTYCASSGMPPAGGGAAAFAAMLSQPRSSPVVHGMVDP